VSWIDVGPFSALTPRGARVLRIYGMAVAVFRTSSDEVFALHDSCPHRGGPLSQGIVHGARVTCPLHDWVIDLKSGGATGADEGCTRTFPVRVEGGRVLVDVPESGAEAAQVAACDRHSDGQSRAAEQPLAVFEPG
jgi:nitrite reductase [NAD(P)H] small subunit